jgi:hypothetical protein
MTNQKSNSMGDWGDIEDLVSQFDWEQIQHIEIEDSEPFENGVNIESTNSVCIGNVIDVVPYLDFLFGCIRLNSIRKYEPAAKYIILQIIGRRNLKKQPLRVEDLTDENIIRLKRIKKSLKGGQLKRIHSFIHDNNVPRRLIDFMVVRYTVVNKIDYYLDITEYPYKLVGSVNNWDEEEVKRLIANGRNIVYRNLHLAYMNFIPGHQNHHAPYARSPSVDDNGDVIGIGDTTFYIWFDDNGGMDVFWELETSIRAAYFNFERENQSRKRDHAAESIKKMKKKKLVKRNTEGVNYNSVSKIKTSVSFKGSNRGMSFESWFSQAKQTMKESTSLDS